MEILQNILEAEIIQQISWTLLHFIWQAIVTGIVTAIVLRCIKNSSASVRYTTTSLAMLILMLMPLVTFPLVTVEKQEVVSPVTLENVSFNENSDISTNISPVVIINEEPKQMQTVNNDSQVSYEAFLPYLALCWLAGITILSIWHIGGWFQIQKLRWQTIKPVTNIMTGQMQILAGKLGIKKIVKLVESSLVQVPTVVGHFKPVILMPASIMTGISVEQVEYLLAHELSHIRRNDYLINIIQTAFEILGFFHPVVWWLSKHIRTERENCCDDMAIAITGDKLEYAKALAAVEEMRSEQYKLAVAASGGNLYSRISRLLTEEKKNDRKNSGIYSATASMIVLALFISSIFIMTSCGVIKPFNKNIFSSKDINEIVNMIDIDNDTQQDLVKLLGEPKRYIWGKEKFNKNDLPLRYIMVYPGNFHIAMNNDRIVELRLEGSTEYVYGSGLKFGSSLEKAIEVLGEPKETITGQPNNFINMTLYKDIDGNKGHCYYAREDKDIRIWLSGYKVMAIYLTRSNYSDRGFDISSDETIEDFAAKVNSVDIDNATPDDLINIFGEPKQFLWQNKKFKKDNLPARYVMKFANNLYAFITNDYIVELRLEGPSEYVYGNGLKIGSKLDKVIEILGEPKDTLVGKPNKFQNNTLYKDIDGDIGYCYYAREDKNIRVWIDNNKVCAIYLTRSDYSDGGTGKEKYTKDNLPEGSYINEEGHLIDKVDYPFENDPEVIGKWVSVDFVNSPSVFNPKRKRWGGNLYLKSIQFFDSGAAYSKFESEKDASGGSASTSWTKGLMLGGNKASKYTIKKIEGEKYMFYEWKSGDYTFRHMHPSYYVLKQDFSPASETPVTTTVYMVSSTEPLPQFKNLPVQNNIMGDDINILLDEIRNNKNAKILSSPSVTSPDGETAKINTIHEVPVKDANGNATPMDLGIKLSMTNNIQDGGAIHSLVDFNFNYLVDDNSTKVTHINTQVNLMPDFYIAIYCGKDVDGNHLTEIINTKISPKTDNLTPNSTATAMTSSRFVNTIPPGGMGSGMMGSGMMGGGITPAKLKLHASQNANTQTNLPDIATRIRIITFPVDLPQANNFKFGGLLNIPPDKIDELLKSILNNPESKLLSAPKIVSHNGEEATLTLADNVPIPKTDGSGQFDYADIGLKINITNTVKENNNIQSQISITRTELNGTSVSSNAAATDILIPEGQTAVISGGQTSDGKHIALLATPETTTLPVQPNAIKLGSKQSGGMGGGMMGNFVGGMGGMTGAAGSIQLNDISGPSVKTEVRIATMPNDPVQIKEIMQNPIVDDARANEIISLTKKDARSRLVTMPSCITADNIRSDFSSGNTKLLITNHIAADKNMVRSEIEYTHNESVPGGSASSNSSATSLAIPSGKTCIVSGYNTADYATLLLIKVTINEAEETAKKEANNLEVTNIEFVSNVEMKQIAQGKNTLYLHVKNNTSTDQLFAVHVYTRSPDFGTDGVGWGMGFFETIKPNQTQKVKASFKIQGPITDNTYISLKYYNPESEEAYDYDNPYHQETVKASQVNQLFAKNITPGILSKEEPVSDELAKAFAEFQILIKNKSYDQAWNMLTPDYQVSEYQKGGFDRFKKHMEPVHPLDDGFSWKKNTFLNMKPASMKIRGQAAFQNKAYVYAETDNEKWTFIFTKKPDSNTWLIDDIFGYIPEVANR